VCGMHRCGTSLISGLVHNYSDYEIGDNIIPRDKNNINGYYENSRVIDVNSEILQDSNLDWDSLANLPKNLKLVTEDRIAQIIENIIETEFSSNRILIKDPKFSLVLPHWIGVLENMGWNIKVIICYRNPKSVSDSLKQIDGFDKYKSYYLYFVYLILAEYYSRNCNRFFIEYDQVIDNPDVVLKSMCNDLAFHSFYSNDKYKSFLSKELRNYYGSDNNEFEHLLVGQLFKNLRGNQSRSEFDRLIREFKSNSLFYNSIEDDFKRTENSLFAQLYIDTGNEYSEEDSFKILVNDESTKIVFEIDVNNLQKLRFDPLNEYCVVFIKSIVISDQSGLLHNVPFVHNGKLLYENVYLFQTKDPILNINNMKFDGQQKDLIINLEYLAIGRKDVSYFKMASQNYEKREIQYFKENFDQSKVLNQTKNIEEQQIEINRNSQLIFKDLMNQFESQKTNILTELSKFKYDTEKHVTGIIEEIRSNTDLSKSVSNFTAEIINLKYELRHKIDQIHDLKEERNIKSNKIKDLLSINSLLKSRIDGKVNNNERMKIELFKAQQENFKLEELVTKTNQIIFNLEVALKNEYTNTDTLRAEINSKLSDIASKEAEIKALNGAEENFKRIINNYEAKLSEVLSAFRLESARLEKVFNSKSYLILIKGIKVLYRNNENYKSLANLKSYNSNIINILSDPKISSILNNSKLEVAKLSDSDLALKNSEIICHIDNCNIFDKNLLYIRGWVTHPNKAVTINVVLSSKTSSIELNTDRELRFDIKAAFPDHLESQNSGFICMTELKKKYTTISIMFLIDGIKYLKNVIAKKSSNYARLPLDLQYRIFLIKQSRVEFKKIDFSYNPLISIIVPVYNVDRKWLDSCINSVINQHYDNWELCIYDDKSSKRETLECLNYWENINDKRIKIKYGKTNLNISLASNEAIKLATGDFISLLDNDDMLSPNALTEIVSLLNKDPKLKLIYSDEDKLEMNGRRTGPYFKCDFNIDLLRSNNYITHLCTIKKETGDHIGWFRKGLEGSQDHDLVLRIVDEIEGNQIGHIPKVLYHWRKIPGSTAVNYSEKDYVFKSGKRALEDHLVRNNIVGTVLKGKWGGAFRIKRKIHTKGKVSIIIPFKNQIELLLDLIYSISDNTKYDNFELVLVNNNSTEENILILQNNLSLFKEVSIDLKHYDKEFNYSAINNWAVAETSSEYVLLLNNDMKIITKGWLMNLVEHIQREDVGVVGCKLLYEDGTLQHAGVLTGINGSAGHYYKGYNNDAHYFNMNVIRNVAGVTGACLMTKRSLYEHLEGLDSELFKVSYNDIDYCLKIRKAGYLIVYTPYTEIYHYESKSRGYEDTPEKKARHDKEKLSLQNKWGSYLSEDMYSNPNFSKQSEHNDLNIK